MWVLSVFVLYLAGMAGIGAYFARRNRTVEDFVLGGRGLGVWVTALSAQASDMSAWLLIALPAMAYKVGLAALWPAVGCAIGTVFNWVFVAPRLREETGRAGAMTIPDYLAARFGGSRGGASVRLLTVVVILVAYASYIASQCNAAGKTLATLSEHVVTPWGRLNVSYHLGMIVGIGIILLYTTLGGFLAVSWTDLVQGLLMVTTVVVLPLVGIRALGGFGGLWAELHRIDPKLLTWQGAGGEPAQGLFLGTVIGGLGWGLGYPGQPHILVRFMALKDPRQMRRAGFLGITWALLAMWGAIFVGLVAKVTVANLGNAQADKAMPTLALTLMHPAVAGAMIAAAIAAMMSTADSQLLVAASAVEEDIYIRLLGGHPRGKAGVWIGRVTVLALGAVAVPLAWDPRKTVFSGVLDGWGVLAAGLGPVVILALLSPRTNRRGAAVGIFVGLVISQLWVCPWAHPYFPGVKWVFGGDRVFSSGLIPGFALNLALAWLVSRWTAPRAAGHGSDLSP